MTHRATLAALALSLACAGGSRGPKTPPVGELEAHRRAFAEMVARAWDDYLRFNPELATMIGDARFDDRWSDFSAKGQAERRQMQEGWLERFRDFDPRGLSEQAALTRDLVVRELGLELEEDRYELWKMPVTQQMGPHLMAPQIPVAARFKTVKDYDNWIARLRAIPRLLDDTTATMREGLKQGLVPPRFLVEKVGTQASRIAGAPPEESPFAQPLRAMPKDFPPAQAERLRRELLAAVKDAVVPAYQRFGRFVAEEYAPRARPPEGFWSLPRGPEIYAFLARRQTTTDLTPDAIHEIGLREVARIEREMLAIARARGFQDLASFNAAIEKDPAQRPASREAILEAYRGYIAAMKEKLPALFGRLPRAPVEVRAVEAFREKESAGAQYLPPAEDGSRPGIVQVNTGEHEKRKLLTVESTAYHEGVPGHHLQIAIAQEHGELPPLRRYLFFTAFVEGWALYAERLGKEVGLYQDPLSDYGRLQDEMLRAIRLVVDTGLHAKRWTREQVVAYFKAHSALDQPDIESETDRYIANPGQALAYMIGQLQILSLRDRARTALGARFDVRRFHDALLSGGALPLDVLAKRMDAFVADEQKQPAGGGASAGAAAR
jgi:uncharacterized protein (DUF885 family)